MVGGGVHINAIGGDCPGKTELHPDVLRKGAVFVEFAEQTRIEGDIQQMEPDFPVTELWRVITGQAPGRTSDRQTTIFDSVGFALEDLSILRLILEASEGTRFCREIDLIAEPGDPKNLFGLLDPSHAGGLLAATPA
jgi:ornithine cyclodeaminase